jgi:N-acetylmuramoyl-L-alanine amidase
MVETGFLAYDGADYFGLYEADAEQAGVFVDRHDDRKRIKVLRRPDVPSLVLETHQAWDWEENARWSEDRTYDALAGAVLATAAELAGHDSD